MKIIHTADLHLGMHPDRGQPWSDERYEALWNALRRIIEDANREDADLLLIAGDLFHRQPLSRDLKEVNSLFASLSRCRVVLIAGNHDCITARSHYRDFQWAENVTFLADSHMDSVFFSDLNVQIHGFSYHSAEMREPLYDNIKAPADGRIHILLAHGGDEKHIPVDKNRLAAAGFHYTALGHIHKPELREELRLAWCGSPEPTDCTDLGERGYISAHVTANETHLRFVPVSTAQYIPLTVTVTPDTTREGLLASLQQAVLPKGLQNMFLISLQGERSPETDFSCAVPFHARIAQWTDRTTAAFDLDRLRRDHQGDLLGCFLEEMDRLPPGPLREKALSYGLRACLEEGGRP